MSSEIRSIEDVDVKGKLILVRADLNVPLKGNVITDSTRIDRFLPTAKGLAARGARVVIMSHLGRPEGEANPTFSLAPIAKELAEKLGANVRFSSDCVGSAAESMVHELNDGDVALLENLRFHKGETNNDDTFATRLSVLADIYVNDAFSTAHRAHASTDAITRKLPSYAGPSLMAEINALSSALTEPEKPVAALVGGAKVSSKIGVLEYLVPKMDKLIIGGGMANTFLAALGYEVGKSLCEMDALDTARSIMEKAKASGCELILPEYVVVAKEFAAGAANEVVAIDAIPEDAMALDVGPASEATTIEALKSCKTLLWNGPLGAFEIEPFGHGTFAVAKAAAELTKQGKLITVAGGGDTAAALNAAGASNDFTYLSTAGGAFLEWLEGRELPGVAALIQSSNKTEAA